MSVLVGGDPKGELLIFLHGFPETAYLAWHHQLDHFSRLGYFVVAPDQRGYNNSAKFSSLMDYHLDLLAADIIGLIDHFGREKASVSTPLILSGRLRNSQKEERWSGMIGVQQ